MQELPFDAAGDRLEAIFGKRVALEPLREIDTALRAFADGLGTTHGLTVDDYPGPPRQLRLGGYVTNVEVTFVVALFRGDFYPNHEELGFSPERFYVEGDVEVDSVAPRSAGPDLVFELPMRETGTAEEAVAALAETVAELRREAAARPPTGEAWRERG
jgi:hypothetical protein